MGSPAVGVYPDEAGRRREARHLPRATATPACALVTRCSSSILCRGAALLRPCRRCGQAVASCGSERRLSRFQLGPPAYTAAPTLHPSFRAEQADSFFRVRSRERVGLQCEESLFALL